MCQLEDVARAWEGLQACDAARLLATANIPWWVAGGLALDLFRGTSPREHADLDVGVLRCDALAAVEAISTWQIFEAKKGELTRLSPGRAPRRDVHCLWCRPAGTARWAIELMMEEGDHDVWIYRRDERIQRPLSSVVQQTADALPYLSPEIQLLYKSKAPRNRDEVDFSVTWPLLPADARSWLHDAISLTAPRHRWLAFLK